jgi:hypothetical protein
VESTGAAIVGETAELKPIRRTALATECAKPELVELVTLYTTDYEKLTEAQQKEVEYHLRDCAHCQGYAKILLDALDNPILH